MEGEEEGNEDNQRMSAGQVIDGEDVVVRDDVVVVDVDDDDDDDDDEDEEMESCEEKINII